MKRCAAVMPFLREPILQPLVGQVEVPHLIAPQKPTYQIDKLVAAVAETPPDTRALADLFDFVRRDDLSPADRTNRAEALLYVAESVAKNKPRSYGVAEESAIYEMRLRLVARSLRHFLTEYAGGRTSVEIAKDLHEVLKHWRRLYRNKYAKNGASEFKVHEAYSLLAGIPTTETRRLRVGRKILAAGLLSAAVASAFIPFLAVGRGAVNANILSAALGNSVGATGMVAIDLIKELVTPKPHIKPWFPHYMALRDALTALKTARTCHLADADAHETRLAEQLARAKPYVSQLYSGKRTWRRTYRRMFLLGVLDLTERFLSHAELPGSYEACLQTVREVLWAYHRDAAVSGRALEVLMSIHALVLNHTPTGDGDAAWTKLAATLDSSMRIDKHADAYATAYIHWQARHELGYTLTQGELEDTSDA